MEHHHQPSDVIEAEGHLIDSQLLNVIFDRVITHGGSFEVLKFDIGRTNEEYSHLSLKVMAPTEAGLRALVEELLPLGCYRVSEDDARVRVAEGDGWAPEDFCSTTNQRTYVRWHGRWVEVEEQRMDAVIVLDERRAACRKLRDIRTGDLIVCGVDGIRVAPEFRERDRSSFGFMSGDVSSERRVEASVARTSAMMREVKRSGGRIAFAAGPVVVHTGGGRHFCELIRRGYVHVLLSGNALAVHDIECALFGTSLGVDLETGVPVEEGHKHHMRAVNAIRRVGSIRAAVEQGLLNSGIMYECVTRNVDYVLAGSIRDDGPLPETLMDLIEAQDRYAAALADVKIVFILSSMLHGIGVANMLPSWVRVVCVDINPAVVTKLGDRGSSQTLGLVTDVGFFLHQLAQQLSTPA